MKRLIDIENELREVAKSNNLVGDSVELLIKLLAYNRYESMTSTRVSLLESLPDRAANLNSKITHAMNEMYSIYRGYNSTLKVKVKVNGNIQLNKFDKVYSDKKNTLFYSHWEDEDGVKTTGTYNFVYGREYYIVLMKGTNLIEETLSVNENNIFLLESVSSNISEIYDLNSDVEDSLDIETTKDFGFHIDSSLDPNQDKYNPIAFDLTTTDYGLRIYAPDHIGFNSSATYTLRYLPYSEENIDLEDVQKLTIPGTVVHLDTIEITDTILRESVPNFLYNLKREAVTQNRTRSNSDIVDAFKTSFSKQIRDVVHGGYDTEKDILTLNYIPLESDVPEPTERPSPYELSQIDKSYFISNLLYYVTKKIEFRALYDVVDSTQVRFDLDLVIYANINLDDINEYLRSFEYKIGNTVNKHEIVGYINNLEGVKYCTLDIYNMSGEEPEVPVEEIKLDHNSYFVTTPNLNYAYRI